MAGGYLAWIWPWWMTLTCVSAGQPSLHPSYLHSCIVPRVGRPTYLPTNLPLLVFHLAILSGLSLAFPIPFLLAFLSALLLAFLSTFLLDLLLAFLMAYITACRHP